MRPGDHIVLHDHRALAAWQGAGTADQGYLIGLLMGDGVLKSDKAVLSAWPGRAVCNGGLERPGVAGDYAARRICGAQACLTAAIFRAGWRCPGAANIGLRRARSRRSLWSSGFRLAIRKSRRRSSRRRPNSAGISCAGSSMPMAASWARKAKGISIRLAQSDLDQLSAVQRMLLRFGIVSRDLSRAAARRLASTSRRPRGKQNLLVQCRS